MKRLLALAFVLALLVSVLTSCSSGGNSADDTTKAVSDDTTSDSNAGGDANAVTADVEPLSDELSALDYSGRTITILSRPAEAALTGAEIWVEELTNDPVNDAIFNRNAFVCETLGIKEINNVTANSGPETNSVLDKLNVMVSSGDQTYDIVAGSVYYDTPAINQGMVYNLYDNGIETYLDASKPWWANFWVEQAETGDRLYCITGAPALSLSRMMFVTYYNKNLGEDLQLEDMYNVVNEGRWTIDYLNEVISPLYLSLNGDDYRDTEDRYGLLINHYENCDMFWSAFDMSMVRKDEEGWFEFDPSQQQKISVAFEKVYYLIRENPGTYDTIDSSGFEVARDMFANGSALFSAMHLYFAESREFRNMKDEYGILPIPKFDEAQKEYYTYSHDQYTVFIVPKTVADPEMSGAVLEVMAYESYRSVQPTYYDLVLKGRYANDPQSRSMLDMITTNIRVDPSYIYGMQLSQPEVSVLRSKVYSGSKDFGSSWEKQARKLPVTIKMFRQVIEKLEY